MQCKGNHKSHDLLTLADKYKQLQKKLKYFLHGSSKSILKTLEEEPKCLENCAKEIKERFRKQYQMIRQKLLEMYQQHITQIENEMQKQLSSIYNAKKGLENVRLNIKKQMQDRSQSDNLIQQYRQMVELEKEMILKLSWNKPAYLDTSIFLHSFSKELLQFLKHLGNSKFETNSDPLSPAPQKGLISKQTLSQSRQKGKSTDPKFDLANQKSFTADVAQTDQQSNKVFITE